ncbi:hypothetical protein GCM10011490_04150 [Pseudoclavibacter endophyticus]|uniref:AbiEi antitoxin C-terminal domain-containing protein n=1 Tax=Pseudoclavibacter endophyticus TaxID=1778590 RepID=A0A6H9WPL5_9MICO|nr:hypothetical protein [Pseudoclavibacter endophyticus]KAB1650068.1 hypothetical protein F8O04_07645 [Pseudoclavibacter endophyticus]GGA57536.1 hypothetical protein GCM10011490_04150 [Pseudoclavibacter endophyticus]
MAFVRAIPLAALPEVERQAMRLDGDVIVAGPADAAVWIPPDQPDDPGFRASLLRPLVPAGCVVSGATAAWVYDGLCPGRRLELVAERRRRRPVRRPDLVIRFARAPERHVVTIADVRLTSIPRTLVDLAVADACDVNRLAALWSSVAGVRSDDERAELIEESRAAMWRRRGAERAAGRLRAALGPEWDRPDRAAPTR